MSKFPTVLKRLVLGRPFRSDRLSHTLLPKRIALPIFASDALSSVAYAPEEIFLTLSVAGLSAYAFAPWIGVAVALVMLVVVASYRQNVHAYPSGGGDYEVANTNLGGKFGLTVASALLVDYVLTVAVSTSSGVANIGSAIPWVAQHKVIAAVIIVVVLTALNLRGVRESGKAFAIPTYGFIIGILGMVIWGLIEAASGADMRAESADFQLHEEASLTGFAFFFLLLRTFSSGAAALTGVEAISNGVPAFQKPKSKNAATTLLMMGVLAVTMLVGIITLAIITDVKFAEHPETQLTGTPAGYEQKTIVAQIAQAVFADFTPAFYYISFATGIILLLAANTAFNGFPVLGSILAQDRYLPRQLHTRGDRLAFSNGILFLSAFALVLIIAFDAEVTKLIQLYIVGVFVSFTVSQAGMIRHWNRLLARETDPAVRRRMRRSQTVNAIGLTMTGTVLIIVLVTKFLLGAWIAIAAMVAIYVLMTAIRKHYDRVAEELREMDRKPAVLPSRNHAIVLISKLHLPTLRAVSYAKAVRPDVLEAVTVNVDDVETRKLVQEWDDHNFKVPLKVIESPYREITKPVLDYVKRVRGDNPRNVVTVFIPEYVVGHWWEQVLHNQSALRLKGRLLFQPGVMVTSVPWQLESSEKAIKRDRKARPAAGDVRRGFTPVVKQPEKTKDKAE
ncbi:APC family permease [Amycolatopsis keratiniphila]|uniref:Amino acid transporter n=2 Tax=Amycolatopsis keratiniphila TaxID=129921 RepID=R4SNQ8_9PSEU|nr:APC family permease [Amycolatopsis keratiniphila]AGM05184.1 amino acid transporter [Amycolatopsis keratiniphila]OLZ48835.1 DNA-binding protein [Amycolatopsis keratiniphila subsp. nogabecina]ONF64194.1 DNA-binding protein [Amycolatopsis keratiniphila subsp. keratiniphila]SDU33658.1 Amino acid transporter [Amycolatopsis keratiniphila]